MTAVGLPSRQLRELERIGPVIADLPGVMGALVIGSLASERADAASDVDLLIGVEPGEFSTAWSVRHQLHATSGIVAWDKRSAGEIGAHRWVNHEVVLVEALFATPTSGARLAPPWRVLIGPPDLGERFPHRPPISRNEFDSSGAHPVDAAFEQLKTTLRRYA
jgi:predicted nucleotidyltransferase